jgi:hypothetical protein
MRTTSRYVSPPIVVLYFADHGWYNFPRQDYPASQELRTRAYAKSRWGNVGLKCLLLEPLSAVFVPSTLPIFSESRPLKNTNPFFLLRWLLACGRQYQQDSTSRTYRLRGYRCGLQLHPQPTSIEVGNPPVPDALGGHCRPGVCQGACQICDRTFFD